MNGVIRRLKKTNPEYYQGVNLILSAQSILSHYFNEGNAHVNPETGYIYKLISDQTDKIYVGSTMREPDGRYAEHLDAILDETTDVYKYYRDNNVMPEMVILEKVPIYCYQQILLLEDLHIILNDTFDNGLNMRWNTHIMTKFNKNEYDIAYKLVREYYTDYANRMVEYHKCYHDVIGLLSKQTIGDIYLSTKANHWIREDFGEHVCTVYLELLDFKKDV